MEGAGKTLMILGAVVFVIGLLFAKVPGLGRLPGDLYIRKGSFTFYFPFTTCLLLSLLLTLVLTLFGKK